MNSRFIRMLMSDYCEIDFNGTRRGNCKGLGNVIVALRDKALRDKRSYFIC